MHQLLCMLYSAHIGKSPLKEPLQPVKEKKGSGTGMGTLMPTMPTSISFWNLRAAAPACNHAASQRKESMQVTAVRQHVSKHENMQRQQPASAGPHSNGACCCPQLCRPYLTV